MRITTFKDLEGYLYSRVVLPIRQLNVPEMDFGSPMTGDKGEAWTIRLDRAPTRSFRRQGPRRRAARYSDYLIKLRVGEDNIVDYILASYNVSNHNVVMYEHPFKLLKAMPLFGKMHDVFTRHTPFNKIRVDSFPPRYRPTRERAFVNPEAPEYPFDDDEGYEEEDI